MAGEPPQERAPDIELGVSIRARTLRFETVPEVRTGSDGTPGHSLSTESERYGLPDRVEPGVTYRDVRFRGRARLRIEEAEE